MVPEGAVSYVIFTSIQFVQDCALSSTHKLEFKTQPSDSLMQLKMASWWWSYIYSFMSSIYQQKGYVFQPAAIVGYAKDIVIVNDV